MDVAAALEARTYRADLDTVLEIGDGFRSDGGRFALSIRSGRAQCVRTDAAAEFVMDLDVLGMLYLGVHRVSTLAVANRIRGGSAEALARLDVAFGSDVPAQLGFGF
jgi:predicted acetyltransferase